MALSISSSASTVPYFRYYVYIVCRLNLTANIKYLVPSYLFYHYGDTNDVFPIGGLVDIGETLIALILRYLRELVGFRLANGFPMFPCNVVDGYKDHEPIKNRLYVIDVLWDHCRYRNSYNALSMGSKLIADMARLARHNSVGVVNHLATPTSVECPMIDDLMITVHYWDSYEIKSCCFDECELDSAYQIKGNLGADASIVPLFHDKTVMRAMLTRTVSGQLF